MLMMKLGDQSMVTRKVEICRLSDHCCTWSDYYGEGFLDLGVVIIGSLLVSY